MTGKELLRRLVLQESEDYSDSVEAALRAMGHGRTAWVKVKGSTVEVYCYDEETAEALVSDIGGTQRHTSSPRDPSDTYWLWRWTAPVTEIE